MSVLVESLAEFDPASWCALASCPLSGFGFPNAKDGEKAFRVVPSHTAARVSLNYTSFIATDMES